MMPLNIKTTFERNFLVKFWSLALIFVAPVAQLYAKSPRTSLCQSIFVNSTPKIQSKTKAIEADVSRVKFEVADDITSNYFENLSRISEMIGNKFESVMDAESVLYPMTGYDGAAAFRMFPNAKTVVGIDNHELVPTDYILLKKGQKKVIITTEEHGSAWESTVDFVDNAGNLLQPILASLSSNFPKFRLKKLIFFVHTNKQGRLRNFQSVDGMIEFDNGPKTPVRRYIHINRDISEMNDYSESSQWWKPFIQFNKLNAILIKGSNNALDSRRTDQDNIWSAREYMKSIIRANTVPLILIEGSSRINKINPGKYNDVIPEFSGVDSYFPEADRREMFRLNNRNKLEFSYGRVIHVREYHTK